ncbi:MAG: hypothetical protein GEU73_04685 [Chloroflexi bacterium]|nr:hypothetical protein [Chloroflexota bacterium]
MHTGIVRPVELRDYLVVLRRRWIIIALATVLTLVVGGAFALRGPAAYEASIRLVVSVGGGAATDVPPYVYTRELNSWLASEYLADDLSQILQSDAFAGDVSAYLGESVSKAAIQGTIRPQKTHRILEVSVQSSDPEQARRIAGAIGDVIRTQSGKYLAQLATTTGQVTLIDFPVVRPASTTGSLALDLGLRGALGLFGGLFLAFLVDYLDARIRTQRDVERVLGLTVLGEIPSGTR